MSFKISINVQVSKCYIISAVNIILQRMKRYLKAQTLTINSVTNNVMSKTVKYVSFVTINVIFRKPLTITSPSGEF